MAGVFEWDEAYGRPQKIIQGGVKPKSAPFFPSKGPPYFKKNSGPLSREVFLRVMHDGPLREVFLRVMYTLRVYKTSLYVVYKNPCIQNFPQRAHYIYSGPTIYIVSAPMLQSRRIFGITKSQGVNISFRISNRTFGHEFHTYIA